MISVYILHYDIQVYLEYKNENFDIIADEVSHYIADTSVLTLHEVLKHLKNVNMEKCTKCNTLVKGNSSNSTPRDLILGLGTGRKHSNLLSFVRTLRTVESQATFIMITDDEMLQHGLNANEKQEMINCGTIFLNIKQLRTYRGVGLVMSRNVIFLSLLQNIWSSFDRVIITDLYDTYFQSDPFTTSFSKTQAIATRENVEILVSPPNREWIMQTDPNYTYSKYQGKYVINGGLWYGGTQDMLDFLYSYINLHIWFNYSKHMNDQSILNMMYVDGLLPSSFSVDHKGYMVSATNWQFHSKPNEFGMFKTGNVYPVTLHQYNRIVPIRKYLPQLCPPLGSWDTRSYGHHIYTTQWN